jgi:hypothetical protein
MIFYRSIFSSGLSVLYAILRLSLSWKGVMNIKRAELAKIIMIRRAIKQRVLSLIDKILEI